MEEFKTLEIVRASPGSAVFHLRLNRPSSSNALSLGSFAELPLALASLDRRPDALAVVLSGAGDHFCSGIDLAALGSVVSSPSSLSAGADRGRAGERLRREIKSMQGAVTAIERCRKPVIAAVHGACVGGRRRHRHGVRREEVDLAITADLGTLQRLPGIVGYGNAMELALTGRRVSGSEAKELGLVSRVFGSKRELDDGVRVIAEAIASKSPMAVTGTKAVLLKSRDMSVDQGLDYVATWNSAMLLSNDLAEAVSAHMQKRKPVFAKL
ncbi:hypothetical protein NL676_019942 [Syzygium grande]|nr:hypothetical protein NL676_019942 [Syzygium grande]